MSFRNGWNLFAAAVVVVALAGLIPQAVQAAPFHPVLKIEKADGITRIFHETKAPNGEVRRTELRATPAEVRLGSSGGDPSGLTAFATWQENGERWFTFTRDTGKTWVQASRLQDELRLRDGAVAPGRPLPAPGQGLALAETGRLFLVQFKTAGLPEWRQALRDRGAELLAHFPHNGQIVRVAPALAAPLRGLEFVERVEPYHPWYRIEQPLRAWMNTPATPEDLKLRVHVMALEWGSAGKGRIARAAAALGAAVVENPPNGHLLDLEVTREQLRAVAHLDDVLWIDRWTPKENDMDLVRQDAGTNWAEDNFGYCGQGVRGEVLDAGIEATHMDFDGVLLHGSYNSDSHGTSTYGIVFGNGARDGDGSAKGTGHMPCSEAQGIFADYDYLTDRFAHTQELKQSPYFASFQSNSWGDARTLNYTSVSHQMDDIIWRLDFAIAQSQSNAGDQYSRPQAWAKNIISVGGVYHYDNLNPADDCWCSGASIGPAEDGRIKPDISYWYDDIYTTTTGNTYTTGFGGTSGATPESAGVLGLMVQMWSENVWGTDPEGSTVFERQPHASTIKALMINNSQQYTFSGESHDLTRMHQGWGRPSVRVAKERAATSFIVDEEVALEAGDFAAFDVAVLAGQSELKITLVYPDPPGTTSSTLHRINNLDLKVIAPGGTIYNGNYGLKANNYSLPGGEADGLNTVENVFVQSPAAGTWQVEIRAAEINQDANLATPEDDAVFALVITGGTSQLIQSSAGRVRFDKEEYGCDRPMIIRVIDGNVGTGSVTVEVWSDTEPARQSLVLNETRPGSGKFSGELWNSSAAPNPGDGLLSVTHGDTIFVEYIDADDGAGGLNLVRSDQAAADCLKPLITNVGEQNVTDTSARVVWTTDEPATTEILWGPVRPPTQTSSVAGRVQDHGITLSGLSACTLYYYEVRSADEYGNLAVDNNSGNYHYFETLGNFGSGLQPCHAGQVTIDRAVYSCADTLTFRVVDMDLNRNAQAAETALVFASSSTESHPEMVVVTETGPNTSVFDGFIDTSAGPVGADGILQARDGDTLTLTYLDADDGAGNRGISFDTALADCAGPMIVNLGTNTITDARFTISWTTSEPADAVVEWGTSPALGNTAWNAGLNTNHNLTLNQFDICTSVYLRVSSTDDHGNTSTADLLGSPFQVLTYQIPGLYWRERFETGAPGWTLGGEWEAAAPRNLGGSSGLPDPSAAYNNQQVLGHDLTGKGTFKGDYEANSSETARSPTLNASTWVNTKLMFYRRLNCQSGDEAGLWVYTNVGRPLWRSEGAVSESTFSLISTDLGQLLDGQPAVRLEFRQASNASGQGSGWNIDDLIFKNGSLPDYAPCGGCSGRPAFAGAVSALDNNPCGQTGVTVSWNKAVSWGSGGAGTYAVYRGATPDFVPGPATLLQAGITGLSYLDQTAPIGQPAYYLVRAENNETCGGGPNNGGHTDLGTKRAPVTDTTQQPYPGEVTGLSVARSNPAHIHLEWPAPANAVSYRVYRSGQPQPGFFSVLGYAATNRYDDMGAGATAATYFYLVNALNACNQEGP